MFWYCVKIVHAINWWMEKVDVADSNIFFLIGNQKFIKKEKKEKYKLFMMMNKKKKTNNTAKQEIRKLS